MAKHWDTLPDKGPQIDEPAWKGKKKQGKHLYRIECRYVGSPRRWMTTDRQWNTWANYRTGRDLQNGKDALLKKLNGSSVYDRHLKWYDYRVLEIDNGYWEILWTQ